MLSRHLYQGAQRESAIRYDRHTGVSSLNYCIYQVTVTVHKLGKGTSQKYSLVMSGMFETDSFRASGAGTSDVSFTTRALYTPFPPLGIIDNGKKTEPAIEGDAGLQVRPSIPPPRL